MTTFSNIETLFANTKNAVGLDSLQEGFCWEPEGDALFALGWPHLRLTIAGHADDRKAEKNATKSIGKSIEGHYLVQWPQQVALRYVRAFGGRGAAAWSMKAEYVAAAAAAESQAVTEDEAREMLADRVRRGGPTGEWFVEHFVLLLESMVGTEVVLDGLTTALEGEVGTDNEVHQIGYTLGFLLLRVGQKAAKKQRARLQAVLEKTEESDDLYDGLACSLGGAEAARAMGMNPDFYHHAADDPQAVREAITAGEWLPSARHVFIGGEAVLETIAPFWKKQKGSELHRKLALQLAPIRSAVAVRILADMASKSKAKKQLPKICAPYAKHMKPHLDALVKDEAVGPGAESLLASFE